MPPGYARRCCRAGAIRSASTSARPSSAWTRATAPPTRRCRPACTTTRSSSSRCPRRPGALLAVNHEYTDDGLLHPDGMRTWNADKVRKSQAAHGVGIVESATQGKHLGGRAAVEVRAPHHRLHADAHVAAPRPGAPLLGAGDRARHDQQLRGRPHAVGHVPHLRGELQRLLRQHAAAIPRRAAALRHQRDAAAATAGTSTTRASTPRRIPTSRTASAGWWRSIPTTRRRSR